MGSTHFDFFLIITSSSSSTSFCFLPLGLCNDLSVVQCSAVKLSAIIINAKQQRAKLTNQRVLTEDWPKTEQKTKRNVSPAQYDKSPRRNGSPGLCANREMHTGSRRWEAGRHASRLLLQGKKSLRWHCGGRFFIGFCFPSLTAWVIQGNSFWDRL